jgi:hypothetical protein
MVNPFPPESDGTTVRSGGDDEPGRGLWWGVGIILIAVVVAIVFGSATNTGADVARDVVSAQALAPVGRHTDQVSDRTVTTVVYGQEGHRLARSIVSGPPLGAPPGSRSVGGRAPVVLAFDANGRVAVMTVRGGHSVVASAVGVPLASLVRAARTR